MPKRKGVRMNRLLQTKGTMEGFSVFYRVRDGLMVNGCLWLQFSNTSFIIILKVMHQYNSMIQNTKNSLKLVVEIIYIHSLLCEILEIEFRIFLLYKVI